MYMYNQGRVLASPNDLPTSSVQVSELTDFHYLDMERVVVTTSLAVVDYHVSKQVSKYNNPHHIINTSHTETVNLDTMIHVRCRRDHRCTQTAKLILAHNQCRRAVDIKSGKRTR